MTSDSSAFKNLINHNVVILIAEEIYKVHSSFRKNDFIQNTSALNSLELKARVLLITESLKKNLPEDYLMALKILNSVIKNDQLSGFALWPFSEYIGQHGLNHFDDSLRAMHLLTQKFTSEFAVRPYFLKDHKKVLQYFNKFAKDKNHHVRRWVSEGSRPLLPWGMKLPVFVDDPTKTLVLLQKLKYDEELYVRKSVANHLNDISKHHPELVIATLKKWEQSCPPKELKKIEWIKRHALRTLIKKGNLNALKLMGVTGEAKIKIGKVTLNKNIFKVGEKVEFSFAIHSTAKVKQKLVIDYLIHFVKSNQKTNAKAFKLKNIDIKPNEKVVIKKIHSLRPITTMTYYAGTHQISIQINGKVLANLRWTLKN